MKQLGMYKNKVGEEFILKLEDAPVPLEADYWGYYFFTKHKAWGEWVFKVFVLKKTAATKELADFFVQADPINYLKQLLDNADQNGVKLSWQDWSQGWKVVPG